MSFDYFWVYLYKDNELYNIQNVFPVPIQKTNVSALYEVTINTLREPASSISILGQGCSSLLNHYQTTQHLLLTLGDSNIVSKFILFTTLSSLKSEYAH